MTDLDDGLRARLAELADAEESPLGAVERQRILSKLREPRVRRPSYPFVLLGAAAAGILAWVLLSPPASEPAAVEDAVAEGVEAESPPDDSEPDVARPEAPPRPCEGAPAPEVTESRGRGRRALAVGDRARVVVLGRADVAVVELSACRIEVALSSGRIAVHARDLAGGELSVRSGDIDVVVRGTVFEVQAVGGGVEVALAEGAVSVRRAEEELARLGPGRVARVSEAGGLELGQIDDARRAELMTVATSPLRRGEGARPAASGADPPVASVTEGTPEVRRGTFRLGSTPMTREP